MAIIDLGKVSITWRGAYDGSTAYTPKDAVVYNNASYICIANTTGTVSYTHLTLPTKCSV